MNNPDYRGIKIKKNTLERLKNLKEYILKYGINELIEDVDYVLKSLSYDNIIIFLLDLGGFV